MAFRGRQGHSLGQNWALPSTSHLGPAGCRSVYSPTPHSSHSALLPPVHVPSDPVPRLLKGTSGQLQKGQMWADDCSL